MSEENKPTFFVLKFKIDNKIWNKTFFVLVKNTSIDKQILFAFIFTKTGWTFYKFLEYNYTSFSV